MEEDANRPSASDALADEFGEVSVAGGFGVRSCGGFKLRDATLAM